MKKQLGSYAMVRNFHEAFHHPISRVPVALASDRKQKRSDWLQEELDEFNEAEELVDQVDALMDLLYFSYGTLVELGVSPTAPFQAVHDANMSKLGADGRPIFSCTGKVAKPKDWIGPEERIQKILDSMAVYGLLGTALEFDFTSSDADCLIKCIQLIAIHTNPALSTDDLLAIEKEIWPGTVAASNDDDLKIGLPVDVDTWNALPSFRTARLGLEYKRVNYFQEWDFEDFLISSARSDGLSILTLSAGVLFGHDRLDVGHAIIISHIQDDDIVVFDTAAEHFGFFRVSKDLLLAACKARLGGLITVL